MTDDEEERYLIARAEAMWGGFYLCPTNGRIIEALPGDDKAVCRCGKSNPNCQGERTETTGVHIIRFLVRASATDYVRQWQHEHEQPF